MRSKLTLRLSGRLDTATAPPLVKCRGNAPQFDDITMLALKYKGDGTEGNILFRISQNHMSCVSTEYEEDTAVLEMRFEWSGEPYNPMEEGDEHSITLVKAYLKDADYTYADGENRLRVSM